MGVVLLTENRPTQWCCPLQGNYRWASIFDGYRQEFMVGLCVRCAKSCTAVGENAVTRCMGHEAYYVLRSLSARRRRRTVSNLAWPTRLSFGATFSSGGCGSSMLQLYVALCLPFAFILVEKLTTPYLQR
jgi:hypothetical protein